MNLDFALKCFVCSIALAMQDPLAHGHDISLSRTGDNVKQDSQKSVTPSAAPLSPVPEPSAASLILLSLGGVGLAMKLRKRI